MPRLIAVPAAALCALALVPAAASAGTAPLTFAAPAVAPLTSPVNDIALGDLDGDFFADALAVAGGTRQTLFGSSVDLQPQPQTTLGGSNYGVALADVTKDGKLDAVVVNNGISVLPGTGTGTFGPQTSDQVLQQLYQGSDQQASVSIGDFDEDGNPDVLSTVNAGPPDGWSYFLIAFGNGDGTFTRSEQGRMGPAGSQYEPDGEAIADVNQDGNLDAVSVSGASSDAGRVLVSLGDGAGNLADARVTTGAQAHANALAPRALRVGRFESRALAPVGVAYASPGQLHVITAWTAAGAPATTFDIASLAAPETVEVADLDLDGLDDVLVGGGSTIAFHRNLGNGTWGAAASIPAGQDVDRIAVDDVTGDGRPDLAVSSRTDATAALLRNTTPNTVTLGPGANYGPTVVGTSLAGLRVLLSVPQGAASVTGVSLSGPQAADFAVPSTGCTLTRFVRAGAQCDFSVTFTPSGLGLRTATLTVALRDGTTLSAPVSGTGVALPVAPPVLGNPPATPVVPPRPAALTRLKTTALSGGRLRISGEVTRPGKVVFRTTFKRGRKTVRAGGLTYTAKTARTFTVTLRPTAAARRALKTRLSVRGTATFTPTGAKALKAKTFSARLKRR